MSKLLSMIRNKEFKGLCLTSLGSSYNITLTKSGSPIFNLKYSYDGKNWYEFANSSTNTINTITLSSYKKVYFKGTYSNQSSTSYLKFNITSSDNTNLGINISGDLISILDEDNFSNIYDLSSYPFAFYNLFIAGAVASSTIFSCNKLILKATTLSESCYHFLFKQQQIDDVGRIVLPAMVMAKNCYYGMFEQNYKTKTATKLPALTLAEGCYRAMYSSNTNIEILPELLATTLVTDCYRYIYNSCAKAKYLKIAYTGNFSATYFNTWVGNNFSGSGNFYYNGTDTTRGANAIPTGWTVHTF